MKQFAKGIITMVVMFLILLPVSVYAAKIPQICEIPDNVPEQERRDLMKQQDVLFKWRDSIKDKIKTHNAKCRYEKPDSALKAECQREQRELQNEVENYVSDVRIFCDAIVSAVVEGPLFHSSEDQEFPDIDMLLSTVQQIRVPPPIPPQDVTFRLGQLAPRDKTTKNILLGFEVGVVGMDVFCKFAEGAVWPAKVAISTVKISIAGANAADVYLVKQNETYEQALVYLKDPKTRLRFTEIVRAIKKNKPLPEDEDTDVQMLRAAQAILDPKLGNSGMRIAWDAMYSPGTKNAMYTQALIELGGVIVGKSAGVAMKRISSVQKPPFTKATGAITSASKILKNTKTTAKEKVVALEVIEAANHKAERIYKLTDGGFDILFKHEAEEEIENH